MDCNLLLLTMHVTMVTVNGFIFHLPDLFHSTSRTGCSNYYTYPNHNVTHNGKCYEFILQQKVDWAHAQLDCRRKGGALLTVEDGKEQIFIFQQLHHHLFSDKGVWIGLNDIQQEGNYVWDSGKVTNFTKWAIGQPNQNKATAKDCVLMVLPPWYRDGEAVWNLQSCLDVNNATEHDGWICEYDKDPDLNAITRRQPLYEPPPQAVRYFDGCPSYTNWGYRKVFGNKCYEFRMFNSENGIQGDWDQAQLDCRTKGGYLVTIENQEEETFLINYLQKSYYAKKSVWIGLHDRDNDGKYTWDSGRHSLFSHWEIGQPNRIRDPQCVSMSVPSSSIFNTQPDDSPGWRSDKCLNTQQQHVNYGWICEFYIKSAQATTLPTGSIKTSKYPTETTTTSTQPLETNKPTTELQKESTTTRQDTLTTTYEPFIIG